MHSSAAEARTFRCVDVGDAKVILQARAQFLENMAGGTIQKIGWGSIDGRRNTP